MSAPREAAAKGEDWDGYGAHPTTEAAIETAELMCRSWVPMNDGGMMLEIIKDGRDLTIDIGPGGKIVAVCFDVSA